MVGAALTHALAVLLAGGLVGGLAPTELGTSPDILAAAAPISLTAVNWGHPVSLLDRSHPVWSHLAPLAGAREVTATFALGGRPVHSWVAHLDAPDAYGGVQPADCRGSEEAAPVELSCVFEVPVSSGPNRLLLSFSADGRVLGDAVGSIHGGELSWEAGYQLLDASGRWVAVARDHPAVLPATLPTAERVVITNTGTIPMRVESAPCDTRILLPGARLTCPARGVRPAQSLAGDLRRGLRVVDAVGGIAEFEIRGGLATFAGSFSLSQPRAMVGQPLVVRARGLPQDQPFAVVYRLDDRVDARNTRVLGTTLTRTGLLEYGFVVPAVSPGTFHLDIVHDGVAIATLPFEVTLLPPGPDASIAPWGLLAIPVVLLVGLFAAWRIRRRHRRRASAPEPAASDVTPDVTPDEESPGSPRTGPYPDATPATRAPEAGHRR